MDLAQQDKKCIFSFWTEEMKADEGVVVCLFILCMRECNWRQDQK